MNVQTKVMLSGATEAGLGESIFTADSKNVALQLSATDGTASIKVLGYATTLEHPTSDEDWRPVQVIDVNEGLAIDGNENISLSDGDSKTFEINTERLIWVNLEIVTVDGATVDAVATASN